MLTILTLRQKMSGTGSIYDICSDKEARMIRFRPGFEFAVINKAFFGGYTTHKTAKAAAIASRAAKRPENTVIDRNGNVYIPEWGNVLTLDKYSSFKDWTVESIVNL